LEKMRTALKVWIAKIGNITYET